MVVVQDASTAELDATLKVVQRTLGQQPVGSLVGLTAQESPVAPTTPGAPIGQLSPDLRSLLQYNDGAAAALLVDGAIVWRGSTSQITPTTWSAWSDALRSLRQRPILEFVGRWEGNAAMARSGRNDVTSFACWEGATARAQSEPFHEWEASLSESDRCYGYDDICTLKALRCQQSSVEIELWRLNDRPLPRWTPSTEGRGLSTFPMTESGGLGPAAREAPLWAVVRATFNTYPHEAVAYSRNATLNHHAVYVVHEDRAKGIYLIPAPAMSWFSMFNAPTTYAGDITYGEVGPFHINTQGDGFATNLELMVEQHRTFGTAYQGIEIFAAAKQAKTTSPSYRWSVLEALDTLATIADERYEAGATPDGWAVETGRPGVGVWSRNRWCEMYVPLAFVADHPERHGTLPDAREPTTQAVLAAYGQACRTGSLTEASGPTARDVLAREHVAACEQAFEAKKPTVDWMGLPEVLQALQPLQREWDRLLPETEACFDEKKLKIRAACAAQVTTLANTLDATTVTIPRQTNTVMTACGPRTHVQEAFVLTLPDAASPLRVAAQRLAERRDSGAPAPKAERALTAYLRAAPVPAPTP
jgi:hypothetical protein